MEYNLLVPVFLSAAVGALASLGVFLAIRSGAYKAFLRRIRRSRRRTQDSSVAGGARGLPMQLSLYRERLREQRNTAQDLGPVGVFVDGSMYVERSLRIEKDGGPPTRELLERALRTTSPIAVLGAPGAGKTTLLRHLLFELGSSRIAGLPDVPVYVQLRSYDPSRDNLLGAAISSIRHEFGVAFTMQSLESLLSNGLLTLLVDGLDELESRDAPSTVLTQIRDLSVDYAGNRVVIASRSSSWPAGQSGFLEAELPELDESETRLMAERWLQHDESRTTSGFMAVLNSHVQARSLARSPLLLALMLRLYSDQQFVPRSRLVLLEEATALLSHKWDEARDVRRYSNHPRQLRQRILEETATALHESKRSRMPRKEFLDSVPGWLPASYQALSREIIEELFGAYGILIQDSDADVCFSHRIFQSFYAALKYRSSDRLPDQVIESSLDPFWRDTVHLLCESSRAWEIISRGVWHGKFPKDQDAIVFVGDCLALGKRSGEAYPRPAVKEAANALRSVLETGSPEASLSIANALVDLGDITPENFVKRFSASPADARFAAAIALAESGVQRSRISYTLVEALSSQSPEVAQRASRALSEQEAQTVLVPLLEALETSQAADVRLGILRTLKQSAYLDDLAFAERSQLQAVLKRLAADPSSVVSQAAIALMEDVLGAEDD